MKCSQLYSRMKKSQSLVVERTKYNNFEVEHVAGIEQFRAAMSYFADYDFPHVEEWFVAQFPHPDGREKYGVEFPIYMALPAKIGMKKSKAVFDLIQSLFDRVYLLISAMAGKAEIKSDDIVELMCNLPALDRDPQWRSIFPRDFFIVTPDGFRLLYVDALPVSVIVEDVMYLVYDENETVHAGHFRAGSFMFPWEKKKMYIP